MKISSIIITLFISYLLRFFLGTHPEKRVIRMTEATKKSAVKLTVKRGVMEGR